MRAAAQLKRSSRGQPGGVPAASGVSDALPRGAIAPFRIVSLNEAGGRKEARLQLEQEPKVEGALVALDDRPLASRIAHAVVAYVWYVGKTLWPLRLGVFYPYPAWPAWEIAVAALVIATVAWIALRLRHTAPWVVAGLAWFALGLFPVIGIFQAGGQGMADRFTYLPAIGLVVAVVWSLDAAIRAPGARAAVAGTSVPTLPSPNGGMPL